MTATSDQLQLADEQQQVALYRWVSIRDDLAACGMPPLSGEVGGQDEFGYSVQDGQPGWLSGRVGVQGARRGPQVHAETQFSGLLTSRNGEMSLDRLLSSSPTLTAG